jgi:hypothetical protein
MAPGFDFGLDEDVLLKVSGAVVLAVGIPALVAPRDFHDLSYPSVIPC